MCYTPGAQEALQRYHVNPFQLLARHVRGDWGEVCAEDAQANEDALREGSRLLSAYILAAPVAEHEAVAPVKLWVITEADRSVTTLLLPEEY
ncbi:type I restriction endonuclease subunit M [Candidatus Methylobacter favarea]|uniref:type I restriction endonuclease subunit M n=1 Tax=Candidatus Methylobacter favarea TaxID=2707345 RepID=UPI001FE7E467|nr:type I restriction endonuclease subunit M [Candidatus Methylobacter favarea]